MRRTPLAGFLILAFACSAAAQEAAQLQRKAMDNYKQGEQRLKDEKFEEAAAEFQKAVTIYPDFVLAHYGLGQAHMALKDYPQAIRAFTASRDAFYKAAAARLDGRMRALEATQVASESYRTVSGPEGSASASQRGMNQRLNVLRDLEQVKRMDDGNPQPPAEISLALAGAWFRSGNLEEAEKENKNALKSRPDYGQAHNNLAVLYMMAGRIPEARQEAAAAEKAGFAVNPKLKEELERRAAATQ
jgi:tetratricopeptide (TPR) repeat protein